MKDFRNILYSVKICYFEFYGIKIKDLSGRSS